MKWIYGRTHEARPEYEAASVVYTHAEVGEMLKTKDLFFSESNMERLRESEQQFREGNVVVRTMEELGAMANE